MQKILCQGNDTRVAGFTGHGFSTKDYVNSVLWLLML